MLRLHVKIEGAYRILPHRFFCETMCMNFVFLHTDLTRRPCKAPDFLEALKYIGSLPDEPHLDTYVRQHDGGEKLGKSGDIVSERKEVLGSRFKLKRLEGKLFWLPSHLEDRRATEVVQPYRSVRSVTREKWRVEGVNNVETLNRDLNVTLHEGVTVKKTSAPH